MRAKCDNAENDMPRKTPQDNAANRFKIQKTRFRQYPGSRVNITLKGVATDLAMSSPELTRYQVFPNPFTKPFAIYKRLFCLFGYIISIKTVII
jgi:hypothetical protein